MHLQAFAGIVTVSVGHCHPKVVAAVDRQNHLLQHTTNIYLNNEIAEYAQELTSTLPGNLNVSFDCCCHCIMQCSGPLLPCNTHAFYHVSEWLFTHSHIRGLSFCLYAQSSIMDD